MRLILGTGRCTRVTEWVVVGVYINSTQGTRLKNSATSSPTRARLTPRRLWGCGMKRRTDFETERKRGLMTVRGENKLSAPF